MADRHRVVVVGGGFGGPATPSAGSTAPDVDVTLVDRTNHHLFQPLLYQVATGILPPGLIAPALRGVVSDETNVRTLLAEVYDIDLERRIVHAARPGRPRRSRCPTTPSWWPRARPTPTSATTTSPSSPPG